MGHEHLENPTDPDSGWQREHLRRYVASQGVDGYLWDGMPVRPEPLQSGVPTLLLTTLGWRSGIPRRTPLIFGRHANDLVVVASKGPSPTHPYWYRNLAADPRVRVQVGGEWFDALARTADSRERPGLWVEMTKIWPDFDQYQTMVSREIPVVLLSRIGDG